MKAEWRDEMQIARDVLAYVVKNPEAKDTLEGIARWWLQRERVEQRVEEVSAALHLLVERGLVLERTGLGDRSYYQLNRERSREIESFLKGSRTR